MSSATQKNAGHSVTQIALLGAVAASFAWGCVSSNSNNNGTGGTPAATEGAITSAGGTAGSGATSLGGTTSTAGASGTLPAAVACPALTTAPITDFTYTPTDAGTVATQASFGDFKTTFSGGTYIYPDSASVVPPAPALTSDITKSNWHISGTVGTYSGFGLYWNACAKLDASALKGISMTISSTGTIPANTLYLSVNTAADTISTAWYAKYTVPPATYSATFGTCNPPGSNQYDSTCTAPSKAIAVTTTPTPVTMMWADLTGGKPSPSVTPSAAGQKFRKG
jgi:hypothetical protein